MLQKPTQSIDVYRYLVLIRGKKNPASEIIVDDIFILRWWLTNWILYKKWKKNQNFLDNEKESLENQ